MRFIMRFWIYRLDTKWMIYKRKIINDTINMKTFWSAKEPDKDLKDKPQNGENIYKSHN